MKKWIALFLSVVLVLSLVACSNDANAYLALNRALEDKQYTTKVTAGGSAVESIVHDLGLPEVKTAASISFVCEINSVKSNGVASVFSFKRENDAVTAFATILKMYLASGLPFNTVDSENGKKAIYQDGAKAITILTQAGNTVIYTTEYWEKAPKDGIYEAGLGKILEDLGY